LGFDAGLDRTYISLIERGVQSPTVRTVVRLADVLKVAPSEMIKRMETFLRQDRDTKNAGRKR
jgi:transcriptional regulator with XRE-family HTH domain